MYPAPLGEMPHPPRSSGSDHNKSHIGPSCGTSYNLFNFLISSSVSVDGDNPPCKQKKLFSTVAVKGKKSNTSVNIFHTFAFPYFR